MEIQAVQIVVLSTTIIIGGGVLAWLFLKADPPSSEQAAPIQDPKQEQQPSSIPERNPDIEQTIVILEGLLDGSYSSQRAHEELKHFSYEGFDGVYPYLIHYLCDEDMREKDERYKKFQNSEMRKLILYLKESNFEKANEVNFLQET